MQSYFFLLQGVVIKGAFQIFASLVVANPPYYHSGSRSDRTPLLQRGKADTPQMGVPVRGIGRSKETVQETNSTAKI